MNREGAFPAAASSQSDQVNSLLLRHTASSSLDMIMVVTGQGCVAAPAPAGDKHRNSKQVQTAPRAKSTRSIATVSKKPSRMSRAKDDVIQNSSCNCSVFENVLALY